MNACQRAGAYGNKEFRKPMDFNPWAFFIYHRAERDSLLLFYWDDGSLFGKNIND
jgi:hypothetical protein